jgi:hypothetical protein
MRELRRSLLDDVEGSIDRAAAAMKEVAEAAQAKQVEALRSELALFGVALSQREQDGSGAGLAEVNRLLEWLGDSVAGVHVTVQDAMGEASASIADRVAALETALREHGETTSEATLVAVRAELADRATDGTAVAELRSELRSAIGHVRTDLEALRPGLGSTERLADATAQGVAGLRAQVQEQTAALQRTLADGLAAMSIQVGEQLAAIRRESADLGEQLAVVRRESAEGVAALSTELGEQLAAIRREASTTSGRLGEQLAAVRRESAEGLAAVPAQLQGQLAELQQTVVDAARADARSRETALIQATDALNAQVAAIDREVSAGLEANARAGREQLASLGAVVETAMQEVAAALATVVDAQEHDAVGALRTELRDSLNSLQAAMAEAQREQQRVLRDELTDALVSLSQLVVDSTSTEASAQAERLEAIARRIDGLARTSTDLGTAQAELRALLLRIWGG